MNRISIIPKTKAEWLDLRAQDITSTEVSALFGLSPYMTAFELWHQKKNQQVVSIEENERMKWGTRLQDSIAEGVARDNGMVVRRMDEYVRVPELRIGSSFDFSIEIGGGNTSLSPVQSGPIVEGIADDEKGLLEIKNVDALMYREGWIEDGDDLEAPPHIELQVQHQLLVSGRKFAYIGALVGGNTLILIKRTPDPAIAEQIKAKVAEFWDSIEKNIEPAPDFAADAKFIASLYKYADPNFVKQIDDEWLTILATEHKKLTDEIKLAEARREAIKAEVLMNIGTAEKVIGKGFTISCGMIGECEVAYTRQAYRNFRFNWPRKKKGEADAEA